ncbi:MAG: hypothetical protein HY329_27030 [Chloroflexi bacterium]|nr:hypothetical protein [Chloroflexota bacterium]
MGLSPLIVIGLAIWIAHGTTRRAAPYAATGMTAGMAAMMAAMGTGLSVGYGAGMLWDLGWANIIGVLAGGLHGFWMGRRGGPMATLDGAGGGVMGGLMGPMLAVMLLYLPTGLALNAVLMLALQAAFSAGAVYLVAAAAGAVPTTGWLALVGRVLGAAAAPMAAGQDHYAALGVAADASATEIAEAFAAVSRRAANDPERAAAASAALAVLSDPLRRAKYDLVRLEAHSCCPPESPPARSAATDHPARSDRPRRGQVGDQPRRGHAPAAPLVSPSKLITAAVVLGVAVLIYRALPDSEATASRATPPQAAVRVLPGSVPPTSAAAPAPAAGGPGDPMPATTSATGQNVTVTLRAGRYEPGVVQVKSGVPVRLTLQAIGSPG